jgi:hypothetical protein
LRTEVIQSNLSKANSWSYPEKIEIAYAIQSGWEKGVQAIATEEWAR